MIVLLTYESVNFNEKFLVTCTSTGTIFFDSQRFFRNSNYFSSHDSWHNFQFNWSKFPCLYVKWNFKWFSASSSRNSLNFADETTNINNRLNLIPKGFRKKYFQNVYSSHTSYNKYVNCFQETYLRAVERAIVMRRVEIFPVFSSSKKKNQFQLKKNIICFKNEQRVFASCLKCEPRVLCLLFLLSIT